MVGPIHLWGFHLKILLQMINFFVKTSLSLRDLLLLDDEVPNFPMGPVVHVRATDAHRVHPQQHLASTLPYSCPDI